MQKEAEQSDNENSLINDDAKIGLVSDQKKNLPRSSKSKKYRREGSTVSPVRKESNKINGENIIRSSVSILKLPSIIPILESAKKPSIKNIAIDRRSVALKIGSTSIKLEQTINKKGDTLPKTRNRSLDNSENSNTTDIISILNEVKQQRRKLLSINEYSSKIKEQMKKYHVDGILDDDNGDDSDDEEFKLSLNEETQIKSILRINTNNSHMASRLYSSIGGTEESMIKVKITEREFKNPFQSFRVLKNNRKVFEDVSKNFLERQEILFEDAIDRLNKQTMHYKVKMPKVKISGIAPKKENNNNILSLEKLQIDEEGNVLAEEEVFTDQIAGKPIPSASPKEDSSNLNIQLYDDANKLANNLISSSKVPEAKNMELNSSPILSKRKENRRTSAISASTIVQMKNEKFIPKLFAHYKYPKGNFPEGREQFVFFFDTSKIILWGGINSNRSTDVWSLNPLNLEWTKYACQNVYPPNPRYGHSGILFEKKLYVFGGKSKSNNYSYIPDLEYFNTDDHMWTSPNMNSHLQIKLRKNHVSDLIGRQMIIHGGHTEQSEFLSDTHLLNFNPLKWVICNISEHTPGPTLSGHSACLVMPSDIKLNTKFTVYKFPETGINRVNMSKIKEKGWYLFGGRNKEENGVCNDLWILRIGKKPLEWYKAETSGNPPSPRYSFTMNFHEEGNFVIVHGGRNDSSSENFALNDTYVLELGRLEWMQVKLFSDDPYLNVLSRCGHSAVIYSNKMIIFGGMNNNNYIGSSLFIMHLEFNRRPVKMTEEEKAVEIMAKNMHLLGPDGTKKLERMRKKAARRQLSIIDEMVLPDIK